MYAASRYFARSYFGGIWPEGGALTAFPVGVVQTIEFGTPSIQLELNVLPAGIGQQVQFGVPGVKLEILVDGIVQTVEFGIPGVGLEVLTAGFVQTTEFGLPRIQLEVKPVGIDQAIDFGTPTIQLELLPTGIGQPVEFGTPAIEMGLVGLYIRPAGWDQLVTFGTPRVQREYFAPIGPPEITVRLIQSEELIRINSRPAMAAAQFDSLIANDEMILAASPGGNEMADIVKVVVEQANTGQIISTQPITVTGLPVAPSTRLDLLQDVNPEGEVEGGVPRYDEETDKYVVEKLDFADITGAVPVDVGDIDGGTF